MSEFMAKKKPSIGAIIGVPVLLLALGVIYFSGAPSLSKPMVEGMLERFTQFVETQSRTRGMPLTFAYDSIEIQGVLMSKAATVVNPRLAYIDSQAPLVRSASMIISIPENDADQVQFSFPDPWILSQDQPVTLTFDTIPEYLLMKAKDEQGTISYTYDVMLPGTVTATREGSEPITVAFDETSYVRGGFNPQDGKFDLQASLEQVNITQEALNVVIEKIARTSTSRQNPDGAVTMDDLVDAKGIMVQDGELSRGPFALHLDGEWSMSAPKLDAATGTMGKPDHKRWAIKSFSLEGEGVALNAEGTLEKGASDILPAGSVNVKLNNLPGLLAQMTSAESKSLLLEVVQAVTGVGMDSVAGMQDMTFTIARAPGSDALMVGNASVFQIMGAMMKGVLMPTAHDAAPTAPVEQVPAPAR